MTTLPDYAYGLLGTRRVLRAGFGAMQLESAASAGAGTPDFRDAVAILRQAVELGVDHLDTAQFYGPGSVNELIRAALYPYAEGLQIVTKVGAFHHDKLRLVAAQRPAELRAGVEQNLATLGVERLAAVYLRRADMAPGIIATGEQVVDLDSQLAELVALRDEGKIGGIGLSNVTREQLRVALPAGIVAVQNMYNVLDRSHEGLLADCEASGVAWVPYFPLGSAFAHVVPVPGHPVVVEQAGRLGITAAQAAQAWLLQHSPATLLISGTRSAGHLVENVAVAGIELDADAVAAFDALGVRRSGDDAVGVAGDGS
jgi:aryl-alcohol dehydrogenase-like predicted oxidoreductase